MSVSAGHGMGSPVKRHLPVGPPGLGGRAEAGGDGGVALVFGEAALRPGRTVSAVAIQEHGMRLEDVCAVDMLLGGVLVRLLLCLRAAVV
jgi:hypothetical protein